MGQGLLIIDDSRSHPDTPQSDSSGRVISSSQRLLTYFFTYFFTYLLTYLLIYLLTPWCRFLLEKLAGLQIVKKFPAFHGTRKFITALTSVRHLSLSLANPIQSIYPHPTSWRSILILSTHLRLGLPSGLRRDFYLTKHNTQNRHTCPRRDSNAQSQQASGRRPRP